MNIPAEKRGRRVIFGYFLNSHHRLTSVSCASIEWIVRQELALLRICPVSISVLVEGLFGWMPFEMPTPLQIVLGVFT